jgi:solute carrier family 35 protein F5
MSLVSNYGWGLIFIVVVAFLWAASSLLTQFLYSNFNLDSPFLVTYIGASLFALWLPANCVVVQCKAAVTNRQEQNGCFRCCNKHDNINDNNICDVDSTTIDAIGDTDNNARNLQHTNNGNSILNSWSKQDHFCAALKIAPTWFFANWSYNTSLRYTSITSSTVLASTGSLFAFLFAVLSRDETFQWIKLAGVVMGVGGCVLTALSDNNNNNDEHENALWGDALGLLGAIGYGGYAVQTRILCPHDETLYSMQVLLGYIGLICFVGLAPICIWQFAHGVKLTLVLFGYLFIKGLFDNVISDYLWLRAVILTNATVATVGLGLTIPLAFASDIVMDTANVVNVKSLLGAFCVLVGFVLVNVGNDNDTTVAVTSSYDALSRNESYDCEIMHDDRVETEVSTLRAVHQDNQCRGGSSHSGDEEETIQSG